MTLNKNDLLKTPIEHIEKIAAATGGGALDSGTAKLVVKANLLGDKLASGGQQDTASAEPFFKNLDPNLASHKNVGIWFYETVPSVKVGKITNWATGIGYKLDKCKDPAEKARFMKWATRFVSDNDWKEDALDTAGKTVATREKDFAPSKMNCEHAQTLHDNVKARLMLKAGGPKRSKKWSDHLRSSNCIKAKFEATLYSLVQLMRARAEPAKLIDGCQRQRKRISVSICFRGIC
jgi:hypothetical protein